VHWEEAAKLKLKAKKAGLDGRTIEELMENRQKRTIQKHKTKLGKKLKFANCIIQPITITTNDQS
jgi:hypothetical protein